MRGQDLWRARLIGFQIFHILKWYESGNSQIDLHSDSVGFLDFQHFEGSQPLRGQLLARELEVVVFCAEQNQVSESNLQLGGSHALLEEF